MADAEPVSDSTDMPLPVITAPVVAARLKMTDLAGHALMIHAGGDDYSDKPEKLGGGGKRIACGVIGS